MNWRILWEGMDLGGVMKGMNESLLHDYSLLVEYEPEEKEGGKRWIGCNLRFKSLRIVVLGCQSRKASRSLDTSFEKKWITRSSAMTSRNDHGI